MYLVWRLCFVISLRFGNVNKGQENHKNRQRLATVNYNNHVTYVYVYNYSRNTVFYDKTKCSCANDIKQYGLFNYFMFSVI